MCWYGVSVVRLFVLCGKLDEDQQLTLARITPYTFLLQTLEPSVLVWGLYCGAVGVMFTFIKLFNFKLHHVFNTGELVEEDSKSESPESVEAAGKTPENRSQLLCGCICHLWGMSSS